jgi:hypothetical protein
MLILDVDALAANKQRSAVSQKLSAAMLPNQRLTADRKNDHRTPYLADTSRPSGLLLLKLAVHPQSNMLQARHKSLRSLATPQHLRESTPPA